MSPPSSNRPTAKSRGAAIDPPNRYERLHVADDFEHLEGDDDDLADLSRPPTEYLTDDSQSIVSENNSPDIPFRYSINPYRGCPHGCPYCYARTTHEYYGLSAGLDFETKVFVKHRAAELFAEWLARPAWESQVIAFSGATDCYQPAERQFRLTRACLEVAAACRQPVGVITKNALIARDTALLIAMARDRVIRVTLSLTTLDADLARRMEPRTSTPAARLRTIRELSSAGVPTSVMIAPVIPGLTDREIPAILEAAAVAGAESAGYQLLRLPGSVEPVFVDWLARTLPEARARIESQIRSTRGGSLSDATFGRRMRGEGEIAAQLVRTFELFAKKHNLARPRTELDATRFHPPTPKSGQQWLF